MQVALFVFVGYLAPVTFFCAGMTKTEKQAKEAVDNLSKKKKQAVSAHARFGLFCCFDQGFFAGMFKAQAQGSHRAGAPSRCSKIEGFQTGILFLHRLLYNFDVTMLQIHYEKPENRQKKRKADDEYNNR